MLLRFVNRKKTLFVLFCLFSILLVDSFFYSQGSYIYSHIHSLYKGSVIFGHSDMFVQLVLHILVNVLVPFFFKKMSLPFILSRHLVKVTSFVIFW